MRTQQQEKDFLGLIATNKGIISKICYSFCRNAADKEDLAQEIVFTLWSAYGNFNPTYKFSTWMYRVALNVAISFYRAGKKRKGSISLGETNSNIEDKSVEYPFDQENIHSLQYQISILKELDKALMILYFEEKTYKEIAEIIGITESNVATKISRIKEKLKHNLQNK